ncbi:MAG TPA: M23 family metallopeptidase [Xanthomonadales bacterium]|nr:M23 family metallopeptidase [Xanthomonadales bacterium]
MLLPSRKAEPSHLSTPLLRLLWTLSLTLAIPFSAQAQTELKGEAIQGGLIFGQALPGSKVSLDGTSVMTTPDGRFVIGFDRDETGTRELLVNSPERPEEKLELIVKARQYDIERVDGLPPRTVTPDPEAAERIKQEAAMVASARRLRDQRTDYATGFAWPAAGRISGVYGSQRILNGEPGRPHYGLDIAAPTGDPVHAPAAGKVTLAHKDMYFSGGTLILDHGQGLSSTFLHLSEILVETGDEVQQGDLIARIGATGRASGPHLDWRMNWLNRRVDPQLLLSGEPAPADSATQ